MPREAVIILMLPNLVDLNDYSLAEWDEIVALAQSIMHNPQRYTAACKDKIMATLFYEPSTRTQMSFQSAMLRLGGQLIGFDNPATSSVSKGENLKDTTKIVSSYADILVMRHPHDGSAKAAALTADCPIINAGDGKHLHPTQTLTDLLTLKEEKGSISGLTIGLCGDLKQGRTVHSLCKALAGYSGNCFVLISTPEMRLPDYVKDVITESGCTYQEISRLEDAMPLLDVLYMTRIQRERFVSPEEYASQKDIYVLDPEKMTLGKKDLIVLHPLPRVDEIQVAVDDDPRALYFRQAYYGVFVRMALILTILDRGITRKPLLTGTVYPDRLCPNPNCITRFEAYLPRSYRSDGSSLRCEYCDECLDPVASGE